MNDLGHQQFSQLSVIIPNFNYAQFLPHAVESALAIDWPTVQVIVVDDGSTDDSIAELSKFGDRIVVLRQENSGPRVACNNGFELSTGDAVLFLDSDDIVDPAVARRAAEVWRTGISKVQFQMHRIDGAGRSTGEVFPTFRKVPSPAQVRSWLTQTGEYPTPPGSGNLYARTFLRQIFPVSDRCGDATDSSTLAAAPYLGDVATIAEPLVGYRVHGQNRSSLRADPSRFSLQIDRAWKRQDFARELSGQRPAGLGAAVPVLRRGRHLLQMRVAESRVVAGDQALPGDSKGRLMYDSIRSPFAPGPDSLGRRLAVAMWCLLTLAAPGPVARRLISARFQ